MASSRKKLFLLIFCLASITQGMYSTYFVSILTTIERIYQIQSKTAGAILSATEIGQIMGSLFIAHYGGRGNKPKWISLCMTFSALAALISISPHFLLADYSASSGNNLVLNHRQSSTLVNGHESVSPSPYLPSDLSSQLATTLKEPAKLLTTRLKIELPSYDQYCHTSNIEGPLIINSSYKSLSGDEFSPPPTENDYRQRFPVSVIIAIFFTCLLAIGFGSTAITTLGIPFMDDIISKEESPLYLGMTIGLRIFGPALGFLLGSFCIQIDSRSIQRGHFSSDNPDDFQATGIGAWWLGLVLISLPLLILAVPMYCLSKTITSNDSEKDDYEDITYQAAEDHDIGDSHDFPANMLRLSGDLDVTSSRTCFSSEVDTSSSREVLQACQSSPGQYNRYNYSRNIAFEQPILSSGTITTDKGKLDFVNNSDTGNQRELDGPQSLIAGSEGDWRSQNVCLVVNHFGGLESTSFADNNGQQAFKTSQQNSSCLPTSSARSSVASTISPYSQRDDRKRQQAPQMQQHDGLAMSNLSNSLSRLIKNRLLVLRMLSAVLHILPIAGFYTFLPKYLIEQFRITSSSASAISGLAGILFVGFGAFIGGTIIRVFNVNSRLMTRWIATSALLYTVGMLVLMNLNCGHNQTVHHGSIEFMSTDCSALCHCSKAVYNPVCANGTTYLSPCLAGCKAHAIAEDKIIFDDCGCSALTGAGIQKLNDTSSTGHLHVNLNVATQGPCVINCDNLIWYVILFSTFTLIHASCEVGSMMFNLRCVKSDDRTLALGLITFTSSLFGK